MTSENLRSWCFTHTINKKLKIKILDFESAKSFVTVVRFEQLDLWQVEVNESGVPGPLKDFLPTFDAEVVKEAGFSETIGAKEISLTSDAADPSQIAKRRTKRIDVRVPVRVVLGNMTFDSFTKDISEGGAQLETPIPEHFQGKRIIFRIKTTDNSLDVEFEAKCLESSDRGARIKFEPDLTNRYVIKLRLWIEENDPNKPNKLL